MKVERLKSGQIKGCFTRLPAIWHLQPAAEVHTLGRASLPALFNLPRSSPTGATSWVMAPFTTLRSKTQPQSKGLCYNRTTVFINMSNAVPTSDYLPVKHDHYQATSIWFRCISSGCWLNCHHVPLPFSWHFHQWLQPCFHGHPLAESSSWNLDFDRLHRFGIAGLG